MDISLANFPNTYLNITGESKADLSSSTACHSPSCIYSQERYHESDCLPSHRRRCWSWNRTLLEGDPKFQCVSHRSRQVHRLQHLESSSDPGFQRWRPRILRSQTRFGREHQSQHQEIPLRSSRLRQCLRSPGRLGASDQIQGPRDGKARDQALHAGFR